MVAGTAARYGFLWVVPFFEQGPVSINKDVPAGFLERANGTMTVKNPKNLNGSNDVIVLISDFAEVLLDRQAD